MLIKFIMNKKLKAFVNSIKKVINVTEILVADDLQCGNYRNVSSFGEKKYSDYVLKKL